MNNNEIINRLELFCECCDDEDQCAIVIRDAYLRNDINLEEANTISDTRDIAGPLAYWTISTTRTGVEEYVYKGFILVKMLSTNKWYAALRTNGISKYLNHDGLLYLTCTNGWYNTFENAKLAVDEHIKNDEA